MSNYGVSRLKRCFDFIFSLLLLFCVSPLFLMIAIAIKSFSFGPIFFIQKRVGKNGKIFRILKFRTMYVNAEKDKGKYVQFNQADGPVFKIENDPRFTKIGKNLSRTGLDELPQLLNVLKGDMSIVGPRPLPFYEAKKLSKNDRIRESVRPGMTSAWVINGSHKLSFKKWMKLDVEYVSGATFLGDIEIITKTFKLVLLSLLKLQFLR